ncbi:hypothetical protein [Sphingomonas solaris]|nr:hypothetical protein [Sphingomonas solaris]
MTMPGAHATLKLFVHETTHIRAGTTDRFVAGFSNDYQPLMERQGARLFGIWEGSPLNSRWPEITTIWEIDGYRHFAQLGAARHREPDTRQSFEQWQGLLGELGGTGEGRLVHGNPGIKSVAERQAEGLTTAVVIQEIMKTKPGRQRDYVEQLEYAYVPWSEKTGKKWLGSFTTVFRYDEVIHYWALDGGWEAFGNHWPSWGDKPGDDIKSWMQLAPALREGWDDSFLQSLPPNPLG